MTPAALFATLEATWPAAARLACGPFLLRQGLGGGQRVSAATAEGDWTLADIAAAEAAMRDLGQMPLMLIRAGEEALDAALAAQGWQIHDPVLAYAAPVAALMAPVSGMAVFAHWPPLAITADLWAEGGIGPERLAVMQRAPGPKTALLARNADKPCGAAFVAQHGHHAMLHALEVRPALRRAGSGRRLLQAAANWAAAQGATDLSLAVTEANAPARRLYEALGMAPITRYHYRRKA